ncbi:hypothetical protein N431DRAFT_442926 [Stipitochalara longipes BDJ]|nr:hypothetical protein N431DRAFT_442926 [Stipitochalara longipes BDJ]
MILSLNLGRELKSIDSIQTFQPTKLHSQSRINRGVYPPSSEMTSKNEAVSEDAIMSQQSPSSPEGAVGDRHIILRGEEDGAAEDAEKVGEDAIMPTEIATKETHPGSKALSIIDMTGLIDNSITTFIATPPNQRIDLETFLRSIQDSTRNVEAITKALIASDAVGQFIKFAKFPPEIRDKIWKHALEGCRIIEIYAKLKEKPGPTHGLGGQDEDYSMHVLQHPHPLLQVCRTSRAIALKKYSLQLDTTGLANSRIDPKEDLVCMPRLRKISTHLPSRQFSAPIWSSEALKLERIAMDSRAWSAWTIGEVLRTFKNLKELIVVVKFQDELGNKRDVAGMTWLPVCQPYMGYLDEWWSRNGGGKGGAWAKPQLIGLV